MNEKTYHISSKKPAEAEAFTARRFNERPAGSFALDAQFVSAFDSHEVTTPELPKKTS